MQISEKFNLKGKTALVTGGGQGIGKAFSIALASYGANIVIVDLSNNESINETVNQVKAHKVNCILLQCDISTTDAPTLLKSQLDEKNITVDILVLNASVQMRSLWENVTIEQFDKQVNTNFRASLFLTQVFYPAMKEKGWGRIITVGSVQQIRSHVEMIVYAATKVAQMSLVKSLAIQFAPHNVTINNIAPGAIDTPRNAEVLSKRDYLQLLESKIPAGYVGTPEDCVGAVLMLCSEAGRYITGQDLFIDGGMSLNR